MHHQFPHLPPRCAVLRIRRLFLTKKPRILRIKTLDGGELLNAQRVKGLFGSPVQRDLVLMLQTVFRRVTGLALGRVDLARSGVVDDVPFQHGGFGQMLLSCLNLPG